VTGPGMVEVIGWRQEGSMTVHIVNLTNPMMLRASFRELLPIGEQRVSVRIPAGKTPRGVRLLVAGRSAPMQYADGWLTFTVPSILDHEVAAIDL